MDKNDLNNLKKAGRAVSVILKKLKRFIKPGVSGVQINDFCVDYLAKNFPGYNLSSKGYHGFPGSVCVSFNENIIHGIPSKRVVKKKDIVKVDVVVDYRGWYADAAYTYIIGRVSPKEKRLVKTTQKALQEAIKTARAGNTTGDIGYTIQKIVEAGGFSVMRRYCGHGVGRSMHQYPSVPNFGQPKEGVKLEEGMVIAIEPMAFGGSFEILVAEDGWGVYAKDSSQTAHFEHTVLIGRKKPLLIT